MKTATKKQKKGKGAQKEIIQIKEQKKVPVQFALPPPGKISHLHLYFQSFKSMNKAFAMTLLLDAAYLLVMFGMFILFLVLLKVIFLPLATALQSILGLFSVLGSSGEINPAMETVLTQNVSAIKWFYVKIVLVTLFCIGSFFAVNSLYKGFIWFHLFTNKTNEKHSNEKQPYLKKFIGINFLWQLLWLFFAIIIFFVFTVKAATIALTIELFMYMYFTSFFRAQITEKHTLKQVYKETFVLGVKKFRHFAIPICMMFITVVFAWMLGVFFLTLLAPFTILLFAIILLVLATAWIRLYFSVIHQKVIK